MDFWRAQEKARKRTKWYLLAFILLTLAMAAFVELLLYGYLGEDYQFDYPLFAIFFLAITVGVALIQYFMYKRQGGGFVAKSMGARQVDPETNDPYLRQLLNICNEVAIASSLPMPQIYILEANQINAFAAGLTTEKAAVCITRGALEKLSRDELQGVIAHEFGHIYNGDMRISLQLSAMLMGFFFILYIAMRLLFASRLTTQSNRSPPLIYLIALIFLAAGAVSWFFGSILRATVSRQREFLADACAVQFTRSSQGISDALLRIGQESLQDMPSTGMAYSHLYFDFRYSFSEIFATHPPLKKRIEALRKETYLPEEWKAMLHKKESERHTLHV